MSNYNTIEDINLRVQSQAIGTIIINWDKETSSLFCVIHTVEDTIDQRLTLDREEMESFRNRFQMLLTKYVKEKYSPDQLKAILEKLQGLGHKLFKRIIPIDFHSIIRNWPNGSIVNVRTNESCIPWELLYDGENFLGLRFILCRLPRVTKRTTTNQTDAPKCIVHVKGETVKAFLSSSEIFGKYSLPVREPVPVTIDSVRKLASHAAILDFLCHCEIDKSLVSYFCLGPNINQELQATEIESFSLQENAIVFANACQSTGANMFLNELLDFATEFYKVGAQAYIGTIGKIPVNFAPLFSKVFYEYLKEVPAFKALYKAKMKYYTLYKHKLIEAGLLQKSEEDSDINEVNINEYIPNPFWLYYSYYGNPARWKPIQGDQHVTNH